MADFYGESTGFDGAINTTCDGDKKLIAADYDVAQRLDDQGQSIKIITNWSGNISP